MRPRQNGRRFPDDIFKCIFMNENVWILIKISLKFVPKGPINDIPSLVQIMAWRRSGGKPLSEPIMVSLLTHICVTRPQWVNIWSRSAQTPLFIRMFLFHYGQLSRRETRASFYIKTVFSGVNISFIKIRRSWDCLIITLERQNGRGTYLYNWNPYTGKRAYSFGYGPASSNAFLSFAQDSLLSTFCTLGNNLI